jgi:hypothetical protein
MIWFHCWLFHPFQAPEGDKEENQMKRALDLGKKASIW